jgi:hypothetical protein
LWFACLACLVVAHRRTLAPRLRSSIAVAALAFVVLYWGALAVLHGRALTRAHVIAEAQAAGRQETMLRVAAMPSFADPSKWRVLAETERATYRFDTSLLTRVETELSSPAALARFEKPQGEAAALVSLALHSASDDRAEIFLDFARFPATRVETQNCAEEMFVQFADLRFTEPGTARRTGNFSLEIPVLPAR